MKKLFIYFVVVICISSCNPIEEMDSLPPVESEEEVATEIGLEVNQISPGSNEIALYVKDGNIVLWEVDGQSSYNTTDTVKLTSTGTKDVYCNVVREGGIACIKREVEVTIVQGLVPTPLSYLVGFFGDGETWVYASDYGNGTLHWYLSSPTNWESAWWCPIADGVIPADGGFEDQLLFERIDGINYLEITPTPGAESIRSEFEFDEDNMTITLKDMDICDYDFVFVEDIRVYQIKLLNKKELVLFQDVAGSNMNCGYVWRFKKK